MKVGWGVLDMNGLMLWNHSLCRYFFWQMIQLHPYCYNLWYSSRLNRTNTATISHTIAANFVYFNFIMVIYLPKFLCYATCYTTEELWIYNHGKFEILGITCITHHNTMRDLIHTQERLYKFIWSQKINTTTHPHLCVNVHLLLHLKGIGCVISTFDYANHNKCYYKFITKITLFQLWPVFLEIVPCSALLQPSNRRPSAKRRNVLFSITPLEWIAYKAGKKIRNVVVSLQVVCSCHHSHNI